MLRTKSILIALLLLAFTGQSIAFGFMVCELGTMPAPTPSAIDAHMNHSMPMEHNQSDNSSSDYEQSDNTDCCDNACPCISGACASVALFSSVSNSFAHAAKQYVSLEGSRPFDRVITSIYKPPILR